MATNYTPLLGFALPTTGELAGTWGDVVNDSITSLVEASIAGVATTSVTSGDWTLTTTGSGQANQARCAILIPTGSPGTTRYIEAPKSSKAYIVINSTDSAVVLRGGPSTPTTGATIPVNSRALVAWNGTDYQVISPSLDSPLKVIGNSTAGAEIQLPEDTDNGSNYVALKAPDSLAANVTFTLPSSAGSSGQLIQTDGTGTLSFTNQYSPVTPFVVAGDNTGGAEIRLPEDTDNGTSYLALKAPASLSSNVTLTFPDSDGNVNQVMVSDGSGNLSWADQSGGGGGFSSVSVISTNTNPAVKSTLYVATASLTLTLPASPTTGDMIGFSNLSGTTTCVIARNGNNIMAAAQDMTVDVVNAGFTLIYSGATNGWVVL